METLSSDIRLVSLLLTLNTFFTLICFYCQLWTCICLPASSFIQNILWKLLVEMDSLNIVIMIVSCSRLEQRTNWTLCISCFNLTTSTPEWCWLTLTFYMNVFIINFEYVVSLWDKHNFSKISVWLVAKDLYSNICWFAEVTLREPVFPKKIPSRHLPAQI